MMILVAIVALLMGVERLAKRRAYFLTLAEVEADRAHDYEMCIPCLNEKYDKPGMYQKLAAYFAEKAQRYRRAAACPWLPVEPDPPEPEP
jgi:hypothetical protein